MTTTTVQQRPKRLFISVFILTHLVAFGMWSNPFNAEHPNPVVAWITPYMTWTGLWQSWEMFAPDPLRVNAHLEARIIFADGTQTTWLFPRVEKYGYFERYLKERYRKWASSYVRVDDYASLWPDTARYIARLHYNRANPPREIQLIRYWMEIPPPQAGTLYQPLPEEYPHNQSYTFFIFKPQPEDFT